MLDALRRREPWIDGGLLVTRHAAWFSEAGRLDVRSKSARTVRDFIERGQLHNCVDRAWLGTTT